MSKTLKKGSLAVSALSKFFLLTKRRCCSASSLFIFCVPIDPAVNSEFQEGAVVSVCKFRVSSSLQGFPLFVPPGAKLIRIEPLWHDDGAAEGNEGRGEAEERRNGRSEPLGGGGRGGGRDATVGVTAHTQFAVDVCWKQTHLDLQSCRRIFLSGQQRMNRFLEPAESQKRKNHKVWKNNQSFTEDSRVFPETFWRLKHKRLLEVNEFPGGSGTTFLFGRVRIRFCRQETAAGRRSQSR